MGQLGTQLITLFILAIPVASVAWTMTHEEIFGEIREYFVRMSQSRRPLIVRKAAYMLTCEFCFSHYVSIVAVAGTGFRLLLDDWRGFVIAVFGLVWVANNLMSVFARLRLDVKRGRIAVKKEADAAAEPDLER